MEIETWNKEGYVVNYIIEGEDTLILSSGKSPDKKKLYKEACDLLEEKIAKEVAGWEKLL